ncbi:TetR/AcrR family transcriptional regulator [Streptomyces sp. 3N207]|uniref:TetR/AcrR family transcriptional regulator n=1 Tax=Streptomyces sp. 3N207 TaxID=3457417 RepID=UPI003FD05DCD
MRRTAEEAAATRAGLLDAMLTVVVRQGYAATRLEDVAAEARVTRGALYHHFRSKAELFGAAVAARWGELAAEVFGALDGDEPPLVRVEGFVAGYVRRVEDEPRFRELLEVIVLRTEPLPELAAGLGEKQQAVEAWREALVPVLAAAEAAGQLRPGLDASAAAADVVVMLHGVTVVSALNARADSVSAVTPPDAGLLDADRLARTLVRGLAR